MIGKKKTNDRGATALTYGLVVGLVGIGSLAAVTRIGDSIDSLFGATSSTLTSTVDKAEATATPSPTATPTPLFAFSTHTFTTCGNDVSYAGPSLQNCRDAYSPTWADDAAAFALNGGIQEWTVPQTGSYTIRAAGAAGGNDFGNSDTGDGAIIEGDFSLSQGDTLRILVGARGNGSYYNNGGYTCDAGGGGGTFVVDKASGDPLIIAGGGGGNTHSGCTGTEDYGANGSFTTTPTGSGGGSNGNGGTRSNASGGAGFSGNGSNSGHSNAPASFTNGGVANRGYTSPSSTYEEAFGGFGGGGGAHGQCHWGGGGGGGYNGGGSSNSNNNSCSGGGGGGSFIMSGVAQRNIGHHEAAGYVRITFND